MTQKYRLFRYNYCKAPLSSRKERLYINSALLFIIIIIIIIIIIRATKGKTPLVFQRLSYNKQTDDNSRKYRIWYKTSRWKHEIVDTRLSLKWIKEWL